MAKNEPLYPHVPKGQKGETKPTRDDVSVKSWVERDRLAIWITDNHTDETIAEWWDDDARQMFDDGFFKPAAFSRSGEMEGSEFINSVLDYAEEMGFLAKESKAGTGGQSTKKLSRNDVEVYLSLPPYRASLWVENKETGETIWKVEGAESISRFGWKDLNRDQLEERVLKHLEDVGTLATGA